MIPWVIVTKNIYFFCSRMSTMVSFLPTKSLFFLRIWIISRALSITFFSLLLNELTGTYLSSLTVSNLSNLLRGFLHEEVPLSHIFWSLRRDLVLLSLSRSISLSLGTLKGALWELIGGSWIEDVVYFEIVLGAHRLENKISYIKWCK